MSSIFAIGNTQNVLYAKTDSLFKHLILVGLGVLVLAIASQLSVPLHPVPLTFQSSMVILLGMAFGPRLGTQSVLAYLIAGFCGLPVFALFHGGPGMLMDPSTGFLFGFVPAAFLSGYLAQKGWGRHFISSYTAAILGIIPLFLCGYLWLAMLFGWYKAFEFGIAPFVLTEPLKLVVVALLAPRFWKN